MNILTGMEHNLVTLRRNNVKETTKTIVVIEDRFLREIFTKLRSIDVQEEEGNKGMDGAPPSFLDCFTRVIAPLLMRFVGHHDINSCFVVIVVGCSCIGRIL